MGYVYVFLLTTFFVWAALSYRDFFKKDRALEQDKSLRQLQAQEEREQQLLQNKIRMEEEEAAKKSVVQQVHKAILAGYSIEKILEWAHSTTNVDFEIPSQANLDRVKYRDRKRLAELANDRAALESLAQTHIKVARTMDREDWRRYLQKVLLGKYRDQLFEGLDILAALQAWENKNDENPIPGRREESEADS